MRAVLFPGQGAQSKGMGKELFPLYPQLTKTASEILGYSLEELCLEDPGNQLRYTQYTQPALYVVNALGYMKKKREGAADAHADYFAGHSLGEYNALLAAEAFDFETGLRLVQKRGELMGKASGGSMAAVIGVDASRVRQVLDENGLQEIDLANYNTPSQTVISGKAEAVDRADKVFRNANIRCVVLNVTAPFHSRYMQPAQDEFAQVVKQFRFFMPRVPVIANVTARPHQGQIPELLVNQITSPVRWNDSIRYLLSQGDMQFTEIGSSILTKMVNEIRKLADVPPSRQAAAS
jgi:trans-AT polyketide synthase/acyltransferase/oxidoreductase domain-containing protein